MDENAEGYEGHHCGDQAILRQVLPFVAFAEKSPDRPQHCFDLLPVYESARIEYHVALG
jgi:hypothetical protein